MKLVLIALFALSDAVAPVKLQNHTGTHKLAAKETGAMTMLTAKKRLLEACHKACSGSAACASSSCVTECETEAYRCLDKNEPPELEERVAKCEAEVTPKYHNTNPECCCNFLASAKKNCKKCEKKSVGETISMDRARAAMKQECLSACSGKAACASSDCVTGCETAAFQCLDKNKENLLKDNLDACTREVIPNYHNTNPECCCLLLQKGSQKNCKKCNTVTKK